MSVTDELRKYAEDWDWLDAENADEVEIMLVDFATRIDREHKAQMSDENLEADGYIKLPVDADGVPWRIGDHVNEEGKKRKVACFDLTTDGWRIYLEDSKGRLHSGQPKRYRHYYRPTIEDMLLELCNKYILAACTRNQKDELIAEYARRLQIREE